MKNKALVIGIDYYKKFQNLFGCVNDANKVASVLERNSDGTLNFHIELMTGTSPDNMVKKNELRDKIQKLFEGKYDIALLYFSGHGYGDEAGGYLVTSDSEHGREGVSLQEIMAFSNNSDITNRIIVLDSCYSGKAGSHPNYPAFSEISEGTTILTASTENQYAEEENGAGVFTTLFVDALYGAASNLVGDITPGSVYAHIDQSLGPWKQRPVFKTNVQSFVSLRAVEPSLNLSDLQKIVEFFPEPGYEFKLDPSFEPERNKGEEELPPPDPKNTAIFSILQKYNRVNLLIPIDAPHMWHAAMQSKSCKLTVLGEHYRKLVKDKLI